MAHGPALWWDGVGAFAGVLLSTSPLPSGMFSRDNFGWAPLNFPGENVVRWELGSMLIRMYHTNERQIMCVLLITNP